jgi:hypothetical protein
VTTKQASKRVRDHLKLLSDGRALTKPGDGEIGPLPGGLRFDVRATPKGRINVTIHDGDGPDGYIDAVTGGDRRAFFRDGHDQPIVEAIVAYEKAVWGEQIGEVKWGDVLISVSPARPWEGEP